MRSPFILLALLLAATAAHSMIPPKPVVKAIGGRTTIFTDLHELDRCQRGAIKFKCGQNENRVL
jgi:hypothetical protein